MGTTRTYAILKVTPEIYEKIRKQLEEAGYEHAFHKEGDEEVIDMHGIALGKQDRVMSESEAWQIWFAGWLHAEGKTVQELGLAWSSFGGENQLKEAFANWYKTRNDQ